ncbi:MAG: leucine-rich repeat protein [Lachnospiraceae bacterium]|nr:leucine-rich repeat protein [Lachnospiraceae bacterium]
MEEKSFLTPKKFLQCCGIRRSKCTEMTIGSYLGEQFLNIRIYQEGSTFETYFILQIEDSSSRFFLNPNSKGRRSVSQDKCKELCRGLTLQVMQSVVDTIRGRISNPALSHPDFEEIYSYMKEMNWSIDQEAEADLILARHREDAVRIMILLLAAVFQDYYSSVGICWKVRGYLNEKSTYQEASSGAAQLREGGIFLKKRGRILPLSELKTDRTYVRRGDLLEQTEKKLGKLERNGEKRFLLLYGPPGNGKSELARAYASETAGERYRKQFWLTCPETERFTLSDLCRNCATENREQDILAVLASATPDILLVVDNCNVEITSLINELYYHTGEATVLITSRLSNLSGFDSRNALQVCSEDQETFCEEVFRKNYEKKQMAGRKLIPAREGAAVKEICRRVYLNPLFTAMIAGFLREHSSRITIGEFNRKLMKNGLLEAFPRYSRLDFRKDEPEHLLLRPEEVLRIILREELDCIRLFGDEELQVLHLMMLFPAEPMSCSLVSEILGDNDEQWMMESVIERLIGLSLLQTEKERIYMHPLLCELLRSGTLMETETPVLFSQEKRDAFYSHVLEHILLLEQNTLREYMHVAVAVFREIQSIDPVLRILFYSFYNRKRCGCYLREFLEENQDPRILACWNTENGRVFGMQNMKTGEQEILLDLSRRGKSGRYFRSERGDCSETTCLQLDSDTEVQLLFFYEGAAPDEQGMDIDLSAGICGHPLREIPDIFMRHCRRSFRISFPEGIRRIGDWAFDNCKGFQGPLELPESLKIIGKGAFHGCTALSGPLELPEKLRVISGLAFCHCTSLQGQLNLPEGLEILGEMAFCFCAQLEGEVQCPDSLMHVGRTPFYNCARLQPSRRFEELSREEEQTEEQQGSRIYFSPFTEKIEQEAFRGRTDLSGELKLPASLKRIGDQAFYHCGRITGTLQFSGSLRSIGDGAFYGCSGLTGGLDLPDTCIRIGDGAFLSCTGLSGSLRLPRRIREISTACFLMCSGLKEIRNMEELSELTVIREGAFFQCTSLQGDLYLPGNIRCIEDGAFDGCYSLSALYFAKSGNLKQLGNGCFHDCMNLKGTLRIPVSVETVGVGCFYGCGYDTCIVYNPDCELQEAFIDRTVLLVGYQGSTAEAYAAEYGNPFRILE